MKEPYALSDKTIRKLNRKALKRLEAAKSALLIDGFDELNVIRECETLYSGLDADDREAFVELYLARYKEVYRYAVGKENDEDELDDLLELALLQAAEESKAYGTGTKKPKGRKKSTAEKYAELRTAVILAKPNELTHYAYDAEVPRKRDRAAEAVNAVNGVGNKQNEMDKHLTYWSRMTAWYSDITSDAANTQAIDDAGVEFVQWHTQKDEKVCSICRKRDGQIYAIDKIPQKPHLGCRCYWTPVKKKQ